jgi:integrase
VAQTDVMDRPPIGESRPEGRGNPLGFFGADNPHRNRTVDARSLLCLKVGRMDRRPILGRPPGDLRTVENVPGHLGVIESSTGDPRAVASAASDARLITHVQWRARYRDEAGKEHARHFARKVDGQAWLDEITTARKTGQYVDPKAGRVTFRAFYGEWSQRQVWQTTTVTAMNLAAGSVPFSDVPMNRIRRSHIEAWVKAMVIKPLAPGTIKTRFTNVHAVFRAAIGDKIIATDPCEGVALPARRRAEHAMVLPTPEQVGQLVEAAHPDFAPFIALAAFAGLRLGECAGLQLGDVEFLRRQLRVARQVQRAGQGEVEVRAPKYGSERTVYLPDGLLAMLADLISRRGTSGPTWLFVGSDEKPLHQATAGDRWRWTCKRAGVSGITFHDLRHIYASGLIFSGCDVVTVQKAMGHASATTTLNTYAHLWPTAEDRTRAAAADLMQSATSITFDGSQPQQGRRTSMIPRLNERGQCPYCKKKPLRYERQYFCMQCHRTYDLETEVMVANPPWWNADNTPLTEEDRAKYWGTSSYNPADRLRTMDESPPL